MLDDGASHTKLVWKMQLIRTFLYTRPSYCFTRSHIRITIDSPVSPAEISLSPDRTGGYGKTLIYSRFNAARVFRNNCLAVDVVGYRLFIRIPCQTMDCVFVRWSFRSECPCFFILFEPQSWPIFSLSSTCRVFARL